MKMMLGGEKDKEALKKVTSLNEGAKALTTRQKHIRLEYGCQNARITSVMRLSTRLRDLVS